LSAAGIVQDTGFVFTGFLPSKATERDNAALALLAEPRAVVLLEAPHRIEALARSLACLGPRTVTVAREITKQFEEIATVPAQDLTAWLDAQSSRTRGEFVLVIHPAPPSEAPAQDLRVLKLLLAELPLKTAVQLCADITGQPRKGLYSAALELKTDSDEDS
jgi:16S rRNA (cytidine1402-2'-O)-methyltransferase